jgi:hypothetical protein
MHIHTIWAILGTLGILVMGNGIDIGRKYRR